jgi:sugar/nucleoside kinase (ribokinase family)
LKEKIEQKEPVNVDAYGVIGVIDPTGCGNSFCGGFAAGWLTKGDILTTALWGSVAASFSKWLMTLLDGLFNIHKSWQPLV